MANPTIGARIKAARATLGLSQRSLAELIGFSRNAVMKWELDQQIPTKESMKKIESVLFSKVETLKEETKDIAKPPPLPKKTSKSVERFSTASFVKLALYLGSNPTFRANLLELLQHAKNNDLSIEDLIEMLSTQ